MGEKELSTTRKITGELIGGFLLYGIPFGLLYSFIYSIIAGKSESLIFRAIVAIILQGIIAYNVWKCSTKSTFKKRTMYTYEVPTVMKNLTIFTIIICLITAIYNFGQVNSTFDKMVEYNSELRVSELYMSYLYDDDEMAEYKAQKEKIIAEAKSKLYGYLAVLEIGLLAVYLGILPLEKKNILEYTIDNNNSNEEIL